MSDDNLFDDSDFETETSESEQAETVSRDEALQDAVSTDDPSTVETNVDEEGQPKSEDDFTQKTEAVPVPQADATIDGVNRVVDVVPKHRDPTKTYPSPTAVSTSEFDDDPRPESGAALTEWLARHNPSYRVEPDKQDRAEAYLAKRMGLVDTEDEYLEKVVGSPRSDVSPLKDQQ